MRIVLILAAIVILISLTHSESHEGQYYNRVVNASEILEKIKKGEPVEYQHVIVKGDLDFSLLGLPTYTERTHDNIEFGLHGNKTVISSPIRINDSKIDGILYLNNTLFQKPINFKGSTFNGPRIFNGLKMMLFRGANFGGSIFNSHADFSRSTFNGDANFGFTTFNSFVDFSYSTFNGFADFIEARFKKDVRFWTTNFNGDADFCNVAEYYNIWDMGYAKFHRVVRSQNPIESMLCYPEDVSNKTVW
jgi:hypothetical protein